MVQTCLHKWGSMILAIAFTLASIGTSSAQSSDARKVDPSFFYEAFLDNPLPITRGIVSGPPSRGTLVGATIAGIHLAGKPRPFDATGFVIPVGQKASPENPLCIRIISRDGLYVARANYKLNGDETAKTRFELPSKYSSKLNAYQDGDIAVLASSSPNCADTKPADFFVPASASSNEPLTLVVQLRAGDARVRAQLGRADSPVGPAVVCVAPQQGPSVGFSLECPIPLPPRSPAGKYQLSIGETGSKGDMSIKTYTFTLAGDSTP